MSADALPITHARFATALRDLPISALHAKISELQNSISHLQSSNAQLEDYVRQENDKDCYEALMENKEVIKRFEERIELVEKEITEVRNLPLGERSAAEMVEEEGAGANGVGGAGAGDMDVDGEDATDETDNTASLPHRERQDNAAPASTAESVGPAHVARIPSPGPNDAGVASAHGVRGAGLRARDEQLRALRESRATGTSSGPQFGMDEPDDGQEQNGVYL